MTTDGDKKAKKKVDPSKDTRYIPGGGKGSKSGGTWHEREAPKPETKEPKKK